MHSNVGEQAARSGASSTRYCAVGFKYPICWLGLLVGILNSSLGWHHSENTTTKDWNAHSCSIVLREVANVKVIRITLAGVSQEATAAQRSFVDFDLTPPGRVGGVGIAGAVPQQGCDFDCYDRNNRFSPFELFMLSLHVEP